MKFRRQTPLLPVDDLEEVVRFYQDALGFELIDSHQVQGELEWCRLRSGKAQLMFYSPVADGDAPAELRDRKAVALYLIPEDLYALHEQLAGQGYKVGEIRATFYGMDEFDMPDVTGYTLMFGQSSDARLDSDI